jgi:type III pantothenate kinase
MDDAVPPRILAVDVGNTRVKWGIHDGREWFMRASFATTANEETAFSHLPHDPQIDRIIVSNVAGKLVGERIKDALYRLGLPIEIIKSETEQCGVMSRYDAPDALGTDRWAALIGAFNANAAIAAPRSAPQPLLVVMAGTALTVDALTADGVFLGGIIVPGHSLMRAALHHGTAQLPATLGEYQTFPRNTLNAIAAGAIDACAGAVQRMFTHLSAESGLMPHCIGSGGAIHTISAHLPFPVAINDNLVLDGLIHIARDAQNARIS